MNRRSFLKIMSTLAVLAFVPRKLMALGLPIEPTPGHPGDNFRHIYNDAALRDEFHLFLQNVYSLFPDPDTHNLIREIVNADTDDAEVYNTLQKRIPEIKPFMGLVTHSLPALIKQKREMGQQSAILLKGMDKADGYLEVGTTGRYVGGIKKHVKLSGPLYLLHTDAPTYGPGDIVERGRLDRVGTFIQLNNYANITSNQIAPNSLDLVANYIGFHHAPPEQRDHFIASLVATLRPGGYLLLRDHDARDEKLRYMAALAHDVFNAGLDITWEQNLAEIRNFTSVAQIEEALSKAGLVQQGPHLTQEGDPTANTLMIFRKA